MELSVGAMINKAGAGPKPIPHKQLNVENLRDAIKFAISPVAKQAAQRMAEQIKHEVDMFHPIAPGANPHSDLKGRGPARR